MPIYEYVCMKCEEHFEELVRLDADDPDCPACGGSKVAKQFSVFAALGAGSGSDLPSFGGGGGGGGCCGGSCGSCH